MKLREVEMPVPGEDEVVIKVAYSGICGSELSGYLGRNSLRKPPLIFGHEVSGTIASLGSRVEAGGAWAVEERRSTVNGEVRQNSNTSDMIFACDEIVSYISRHMTLAPRDVILTGTPEGVVMGYPPERQVYLQDGDVVTIEIEKLGSLTNRMQAER